MKIKNLILACLMVCNTVLTFAQLDASFGTGGKVTTAFGATLDDYGFSVAIQSDGKIIVAGYADYLSAPVFALARYNTNGVLDNTFGTGGKVTTNVGFADDRGFSVAIQPDGKILVAGVSYNGTGSNNDYDFALVRYDATGALDNTFGSSGKVTTDFGITDLDEARSVAIQADGKILLAGTTYNGFNFDFALIRYTATGVLDNTFGVNGKVMTAIGSDDVGYSMAIQTDGKIVVAGYLDNGSDLDFALVRYDTAGALDNTFGAGGKVTTDFGSTYDDACYSIVIQSDGKILIAGSSRNGIQNADFSIARYNSTGALDNTFGIAGKVITDIGGLHDEGYSLSIQADGKILLAGTSGATFALVRYNTNGSVDKIVSTLFGSNSDGYSVAIQPDGNILVAGSSGTSANYEFALVRYLSSLNVGVVDFSTAESAMLVYPNPIYTTAALEYTLTQDEILNIELFDVSGKLIKRFFTDVTRQKGTHTEILNIEEASAPGNYLLRLSNSSQHLSIKIAIVKE